MSAPEEETEGRNPLKETRTERSCGKSITKLFMSVGHGLNAGFACKGSGSTTYMLFIESHFRTACSFSFVFFQSPVSTIKLKEKYYAHI